MVKLLTVVNFSSRNLVILMLGAAAACGGRPSVTVSPAPDAPEATVEQFLAAVRGADLGRMAELWGTERGPSTVTNRSGPRARQQQLTIMQRLLQNDEHRVVRSETPQSQPNGRILHVELGRDGRRFVVPFTLVIARSGGWLITGIGLDAAIPPATGRNQP